MLSREIPDRIGTNSNNVIEISPIIMYRAYCVTIPVSNAAICRLPPYSEFVSPNGPSNSMAPRSNILEVTIPNPNALLIT
jgi:hypothetical protein